MKQFHWIRAVVVGVVKTMMLCLISLFFTKGGHNVP